MHQGNGTAHIFQGDASVFTLSIHGEKNFPFRKEASTLDLGLADGTGDAEYLQTLEHALQALEGRFAPALVLYLASTVQVQVNTYRIALEYWARWQRHRGLA